MDEAGTLAAFTTVEEKFSSPRVPDIGPDRQVDGLEVLTEFASVLVTAVLGGAENQHLH